jgi:hypothetical protein
MTFPIYQIQPQSISETGIKYFFISKGPNDVVKAVEYFYFADYNGRKVYNLGFGDYNIATDKIDDKNCTDNGDAYHVFNTILSTVPEFFNSFADAAVMVTGSDSSDEFEQGCRQTCRRKNCNSICRKKHQRIRTYCSYVSREYDSLLKEFEFYGGIQTRDGTVIERFMKNALYESVLLIKK